MALTQLRLFCLLTIVFVILNLCTVNSEPIRVDKPEVSSTKSEQDESKTTESTIKGGNSKPRNLFYPGIDYASLASSLIPGLTPGLTPGLIPGLTPGLTPGLIPGLTPGLTPGFAPSFAPGFVPGFAPGFAPGFGYGYGNGYPIGGIDYIDPFFLQP